MERSLGADVECGKVLLGVFPSDFFGLPGHPVEPCVDDGNRVVIPRGRNIHVKRVRLTVRVDGHARNRQRVGQDQRMRSVGRVRDDRASDLRCLPEAEQIRDDCEAAAGRC